MLPCRLHGKAPLRRLLLWQHRNRSNRNFKLPPFAFWSPEEWAEGGKALIGEVSKVNDDRVDNRFYEPTGRFPEIEEDEAPLYLLGNEYPPAK